MVVARPNYQPLIGDSMRGVRLQLEYEKAEERLRAWAIRLTIVVFGNARARPAARGGEPRRQAAPHLPTGTRRRGGQAFAGGRDAKRGDEELRAVSHDNLSVAASAQKGR